MSDITIGVLGVGHIGAVHLQSARVMDGARLVGAADVSAANRSLARRLGAPAVYEDFLELLESESVDVAVVALPPFLHKEATLRAIEAGCAVFVEKPLARSVEEGRRMVDAADRAGVAIGVDHTLRYQPEMGRLKAAYEEGTLGHVPLCHLTRINSGPFERPPASKPVPEWPLDPEATGGGAVMDLGVHLFDFLEWVFGDMRVTHAAVDRQLDLEYEDTAAVTLRSAETGTLATAHCGFYQWEEPPSVNMQVRLEGVADSIANADFVPDFYRNAGTSAIANVGRRLLGRDPEYFEPTYYYRAHFEALRDFVDAVGDGRAAPVSGDDGLRTLELVAETYRRTSDERRPESPVPDPLEISHD
jgi:myo-inositol 2-dehydrogenase/D-chiro-inositol 1-dehydrogenase